MAPRPYRARRRQSVKTETRRRIVDAVVKLHAEHGVTRTTYAMIAKRADVAVPTVYNHFPTIGELLKACTGHVLAGAPPVGPQIFADGPDDLEGRVRALARALCAYYRHVGPWLRWSVHEAVLVRPIADRLEQAAESRRRLIRMALEPAFGQRPPEALVALYDVLLDFSSWQRLARDKDVPADEVETTIAEALVALAREHLMARK